MTDITTTEAQPLTRRARRDAECQAAASQTVISAASTAFSSRRERRAAEAAQRANDFNVADFLAEAAALKARQQLATRSAEASSSNFVPSGEKVRTGSMRVSPSSLARRPKSATRQLAGFAALGVAASTGVAITVPTLADVANAAVGGANAQAQSLDLHAVVNQSGDSGPEAPQVSRTDTVTVSTMGTATAQQVQNGIKRLNNTTYQNDMTAAVQFPFYTGVEMTDMYGVRNNPTGGGYDFHTGVDFTPGAGTPIAAIADGRVAHVQKVDQGGYGYYVVIEHVIDGQTIFSTYGHMVQDSSPLKVGDKVHVGDLVGLVGTTGRSTGEHLHFEIGIGTQQNHTDPMAWLKAHNNPNTVVSEVTNPVGYDAGTQVVTVTPNQVSDVASQGGSSSYDQSYDGSYQEQSSNGATYTYHSDGTYSY
ncbi:M23 family metallopeptidase [Pseudoclavibacter alba]|uniref:M23 family metallopeptidase n=1 Tax=Pseudoclavibacter albus TaxID=272241 RepID=UPI0019D1FA68|nr:M23 family metallopeptidase [Pseudoclavibacter alba]MBN6778580.1 M23 family metallopeptidase [Pseudoclavibacter alba]